jgi:hypothetical protein
MQRIEAKIKNELATLTATCSGSRITAKNYKYAGNTDCYLQWFRRIKARSTVEYR